jgi:hypothetical protein
MKYFDEINSNVFKNVSSLIDNFVEYCSHADQKDRTKRQEVNESNTNDKRKTMPTINISKKEIISKNKKQFSQSTGK